MQCIFIGESFYFESGTLISSVYKIEPNGYSRTDWGHIQMALMDGEEVSIRPATIFEMDLFKTLLKECTQKPNFPADPL